MKKRHFLAAVSGLLMVCSCGDKKETKSVQPVKVRVEQVRMTDVNGEQGYSGTVEEVSGASLSFSGSGTIKRILVSAGQTVGKGQLIAELDETTMQNAYELAKAQLEQAQDSYDRMKQLHDAGSLPETQWIQTESQLKQAKAQEQIARKSLTDTRLYAPFGGYILEKNAEIGQTAAPGMPIVKLVNISSVKVKVAVPENEILKIKQGGTMQVRVAALGGETFYGRVTEKGVGADAVSHTYDVKATIQNPQGRLLPGMIVDAFTNYVEGVKAIFIPATTIQLADDNKVYVWIVKDGKASKRLIETDGETIQGVKVVSGLEEGTQLIVAGQQKVSEGTVVTVK